MVTVIDALQALVDAHDQEPHMVTGTEWANARLALEADQTNDMAGIDFRLYGEGPMTTVYQLEPLTDNAKGWIADNVSRTEGYQPDYPTLYIEHRYLLPLLDGIAEAGLTVNTRDRVPA